MNEAMTVPAASLLRVSTAAQAADGTSLETQSRANREFISARGWAVAGEYVEREGVSGAAEERGDVDRLLRDIRAGLVQVVVVNKVDRFVRDARQFHNTIAEIEGAGALFVSATEGFDGSTASGRMHRSMLAVIAAFERDRIRERTQDGVRETVRMGFWPGGEPRFGLRTVKDRGTKHKRVVLHRAEAATIRAAVRLLLDEGLDFTEAAARLNALGHAPRRAGRWNAALLRAALSGDGLCGSWTYAGVKPGRRAPKGEPITIGVPEVLTPERHAALAEVLQATSRRVGPSGFYLLSRGRLASPCGERYHGTARNDRQVRAYRCAASGRGCGCRRLDAAQVEDAVWGAVVDLLSDPERLLASAEEHLAERGRRLGVEREEAAKVEARIAEVQRALTTTIRDYAKQGLPADALAAATSELQEELESLRTHRGELARWERADLAAAARSKSLWKVARLAAERLRDMPVEDRDRVLELLRVRVDVEGWDDCGVCEGRGKLPGRRGGYRCDGCRGLRQIAAVHVQGVFIERLGDVLAGSPVRHFGNDRCAAPYGCERDKTRRLMVDAAETAGAADGAAAPAADADADADDARLLAPGRRPLTIGLVLVITAIAFEALAVSTALPVVAEELQGVRLYGWAFSGFMLANLLGITMGGPLADRIGPARPALAGLILFGTGLLVSGFANSMFMVVVGRVVAGIGAGAAVSIAYVVIGLGYPEHARARLFAVISSAWVLPSLLGPVAAAAIANTFGWRWVFLGLAPLMVVDAALILPAMAGLSKRATADAKERRPLPVLDATRLALGAGLVVGGLSSRQAPVAAGLVALGAVLAVNPFRRLVPPGTLRAKGALPAAVAMRGVLAFSFFTFDGFLPLTLTSIRGTSETMAGLALTAGGVSWAAGSWLQERVGKGWGRRRVATTGASLIVVGIGVASTVLNDAVPVAIAPIGWCVAGLGMGLGYPTTGLVVLDEAEEGRIGAASSALQLSDVLGVALGTGLAGAIVAFALAADWGQRRGLELVDAMAMAAAILGIWVTRRLSDAK